MKILTVVGARPQFIKAAVVSRCIRENHSSIQEDILHTGQHYDYGMSQIFFDEMDIPVPTVNLHVGSSSHGAATAEMLKGIENELLVRKPDYVLVYGDTNSTLAGALAASKLHIPVAHVEAGERSYNKKMPEEINRIMTDHVSTKLFCCSEKSQKNLASEGINKNVYTVGDVMYDAFLHYLPNAIWPKNTKPIDNEFVLMTLHRAQNTDDVSRLRTIFGSLSNVKEKILLPLHPRTLKIIRTNNISYSSNIHVIDPVSYFEILGLLKQCLFVITDSGGLQKEAYYAGKKCVVLREETEWTELVDKGVNRIVGIDEQKIMDAWHWTKQLMEIPKNIYGEGKAGEHIVSSLQMN